LSVKSDDPLYVPELWDFDTTVRSYLNHGSFGAVPLPILAEQRRWRAQMEGNPTRFYRRVLQPGLDRARLALAGFLGLGPGAPAGEGDGGGDDGARADADGAALTFNATSGISTVLDSFALGAGDEVLITDHIYGSTCFAVRRAAARGGAGIAAAAVPLDADDDGVIAAVLAALTDRTKLAVLDAVTSPTAKLFPLGRLVPLLQQAGVVVLVDAAHAPGSVPVDLAALRPDFWTGNFHKWPCAPRGTALLYVAPQWRETVRPFPVSWREPEGYPYSFSNRGTVDATAWLAAPAVLELIGGYGWDAVRRRNARLAAYGQQVVAEAIGADLRVLSECELPMRMVPIPGLDGTLEQADALRDALADRHGFEVAVSPWSGRTLLRLSAHMYNCEADYEEFSVALKQELAR
jgi:isopenicillin-N epimerase